MPSSPNNLEKLVLQVRELALRAGESISSIYYSEYGIREKSDHSPVTTADTAAHEIIEQGLSQLRPDIAIVSEESVTALTPEERHRAEQLWLVDPLDGTREFIKRNGEFTVNIALIRQGVPVLGVVYAPLNELCYSAWSGGGAHRQQGSGESQRIRARPLPTKPTVVLSRSHPNPETLDFIDRLGPCERILMGSSLKICSVAEGRADFYPRLRASTCEWDTAAAHAVLLEAGGHMIGPDNKELSYNLRDSLLNPPFLAHGDFHFPWPG